jgi:hypothetical protein
MKAEEIQKIKVNVGVLYETKIGALNRGVEIDRDEDPEKFEILTASMANVGEDESCHLLVIEKVGEGDKEAAKAAKAAADKKAEEEAKAAKAAADKKSKKSDKKSKKSDKKKG